MNVIAIFRQPCFPGGRHDVRDNVTRITDTCLCLPLMLKMLLEFLSPLRSAVRDAHP